MAEFAWASGRSRTVPHLRPRSSVWTAPTTVLDAWKAKHPSVSGHRCRYSLREILNSIFYQNRTGCQWAYLPHDLPPKSATYHYLALWRDDGTDQAIHDLLRCQAREKAGRREDPSVVVLDTQPIRAANHVPDVCQALGIGTEPKDTEGIRAKLKRLVDQQILTETQPGLLTLTEKRA